MLPPPPGGGKTGLGASLIKDKTRKTRDTVPRHCGQHPAGLFEPLEHLLAAEATP